MDAERRSRVKELFVAVRGRRLEERADYLAEACGDDAELRREVESLLIEHDRQGKHGEAEPEPAAASAPASDRRDDPLLGATLGRYRILGVVGKGGMGTVYEAEDPELRRKVALKVLPPAVARDPNRLERFKREARSVAALSHPNVVTLFSVEEESDSHFLTMELVKGEPLDRLIPEQGLDLAEILDRATQLAEGLRAAHEQGIVHRDLKPANVIVDTEGRLRILDFGLATSRPARPEVSQAETSLALTVQGTVLGTTPYMSPEQVEGKPLDQRSDIFSFGSILYEMATGRWPFPGETIGKVMGAILRDEPTPLSALRSDLPDGLERIVHRCLAKEPAQRYQSARELREALQELKQAPSAGRPAGLNWVALAVVVAVLALGGWWLAGRAPVSRTVGAAGGAELPGERKIAVLPLRNLGPAEDEFFAAGVTEEIITRLATVRGLTLVSSGGRQPFEDTDAGLQEIGEGLGVDFVLSGSVRWARQTDSTSRVRISPRLTRVADNVHLWAEAYDRTMEDIFGLQAEIAIKVADELGATLLEPARQQLEEKPTENPAAYQAYLRGRFGAISVTCPSVRERIEYLRRAVEIDPAFLEAWATLSQAHSSAFAHCPGFPEGDRIEAGKTLSRAQQLDAGSWQVQVAEAQYLTQVERDYRKALEPLERASEQIDTAEIHFARARIYRRQGRWDEALAAFERAAELDPTSRDKRISSTNMWMRNYAGAIEHYDRELEAAPQANNYYTRKAWIYWLWKGDTPKARATLETLPPTEPSMTIQWAWFWQRVYEGRYREAIEGLDVVPDEPMMEIDIYATPKPLLAAQAYDLMGEQQLARAAYGEAREVLELAVEESPTDAKLLQALAIAYAGLDLEAEARSTIGRALAILPIEKEPYWGSSTLQEACLVRTMLGDHDAALDGLETLLAMPAAISIPWLRLDPRWAPLWDHPRFRQLEANYAISS